VWGSLSFYSSLPLATVAFQDKKKLEKQFGAPWRASRNGWV
jgi:hypothetical protein